MLQSNVILSNVILSSLSPSDVEALRPHLRATHLDQKRVLYEAGDVIPLVYFPTSAVISLVVTLTTGEMTESAMVGRDGCVGAALPMAAARTRFIGKQSPAVHPGIPG